MKKISCSLLCALTLLANSVYADTLDFDNLAGLIVNPYADFPALGDAYAGLDWNNGNNISAVNINPYLVAGVDYTGLSNISIFNDFGLSPSYIDAIAGTFDFNQGFWSSQTGTSQLQFEGWNGGIKIFESGVFNIDAASVLLISLNWTDVDRVVINSTSLWLADNLDVTIKPPSSVPVPAAIWLFGSAILGFAGYRRKSI